MQIQANTNQYKPIQVNTPWKYWIQTVCIESVIVLYCARIEQSIRTNTNSLYWRVLAQLLRRRRRCLRWVRATTSRTTLAITVRAQHREQCLFSRKVVVVFLRRVGPKISLPGSCELVPGPLARARIRAKEPAVNGRDAVLCTGRSSR